MKPFEELTPEELARAEAAIPAPKVKRPPLTPGRLVYLAYHYPQQLWRDGWRWHFEASRGRKGMARALTELTTEPESSGVPVELHYLTGRRFVSLTSIAILSAARTFGRPIAPVLHDDGSLQAADIEAFIRLFPRARIHRATTTLEQLDQRLPFSRFPFLRKLRLGYIHLRKLTDVHIASSGWKTVSDSDVFFLRPPSELLEAVDQNRACFMQDCMTSYGAPVEGLSQLAGTPVHPTVNVGLYQLNSDNIDWAFVEYAARQLIARYGFSYYLEQALTGILLAQSGALPLARDYVVYPKPDQARDGRDIAYHYVDRSYLLLYRYGWRQVLSLPRAGTVAPPPPSHV